MVAGKRYDIIIIGGGLAGLTCALHLSKTSINILLIEKYEYPHHKVCGEYVSNEVMPYLRSLDIDPFDRGAVEISQFEMSSGNGRKIKSHLPLGGFGISRYAFDLLLFEQLKDKIDVVFNAVEQISFEGNHFAVQTFNKEVYKGDYVVGAFGKRSILDSFLDREFIQKKSPWLAVKAHYRSDFQQDLVALHNFEGGYCGLSKVETGAVNVCYLTTYKSFKRYGDIAVFQKEVLSQNPHLRLFFENAEMIFEKPLSISQISFEKKRPVEQRIFMIGDSAGLIHPLCGNGMAMAIHSAKLFSELYIEAKTNGTLDRADLESRYETQWKEVFTSRLLTGRRIQNLLLRPTTADLGIRLAKSFPAIVPKIIKKTHGELLT